MAYIRETCAAGRTIEVRNYYSIRYNKETKKRQKKEKLTSEAQKAVNLQKSVRELTRILNANFWKNDYYITADYTKENRPLSNIVMKNDARELFKKLRKVYKGAEVVMKYVYVAEVGERGALHHHFVISGGVDISKIKEVWKKGWITVKPLSDTGQYRRLAEYFVKWSNKAINTTKEIHGKRWNGSRNLIHPVPVTEIVTDSRWFREEARAIKGYYVDKDSIQKGIHEVTGYPFFYYMLVKT